MKKKLFITLFSLLLLVSVLPHNRNQKSLITVYAAGTPDSYGDIISGVHLRQWNSSETPGFEWQEVFWVNSYDYTEGLYYQVQPNAKIYFLILVLLNETLASTPAEALARTAVYLTLTSVWENQLANDYTYCMNEAVGGFWYCEYREYWDAGPAANTQYALAVEYQVKLS